MTPERWDRIKEVFQAALDFEAAERAAFLDEACGSHTDLRQEVERLLREHREETKLRSPVANQDLTGRTISHYKILGKLGEGGMGVVYQAEDTKLHRTVALKFVRPDAVENAELKARFLHEAEAAAALDHPNICTIHEIDEADGQTFLVMSFVDGESLSEKIKKRPLPVGEALDIATQLAEGLHAAHKKEIVHRDIKSANIMIDAEGRVEIMDFGLARLSGASRITKSGTVVGTPAYMSPEQVRGEETDQRTDIWSLGVVMYEMVTGRLPFSGESAQSVALAIQNEEAEPLSAVRSGVPLELERIVGKAMAKSPAARYQHADELLVDLRAVVRAPGKKPRARSRRRALATALAALIVALVIAGIFLRRSQEVSIAVMPFKDLNTNEEAGYLSDALTNELSIALGRVEGLRVAGRSSVRRFQGEDYDPREAGAQLGVGTVLEGSVQKEGDRLRVTVQLISVSDGFELWSQRFDREMKDILDVQDEISRAIVGKLQVELAAAGFRPDNVEAYQLYLEAKYAPLEATCREQEKRKERYERAILIEPNYAQAHAALAWSYAMLSEHCLVPPTEGMPKAKEHALKALELDDEGAEGHRTLAWVLHLYEWDWVGAEREYERALELDTEQCGLYTYFLSHMGRHEEAIAEAERCRELNPIEPERYRGLAQAYLYAGQYDEALRQCRKALELNPTFTEGIHMLAMVYGRMDRDEEALSEMQRAESLGDPMPRFAYVIAYAKLGRREEAQEILDQLLAYREKEYLPASGIAAAFNALGQADKAFEWFETALEERDPYVFKALCGRLRHDPRFQELIARLNLD